MNDKKVKIVCPIFQKQEPVIEELTDKINRAKVAKEKIEYAEELLKEVNVLLMCPQHKKEDPDCKNCHTIGALRKVTAELIIKTKSLI